jgi:predicted metal-dependent hydrolase
MNTQEAFKALETIEQSWREDRIRSDLLPAIQLLRRILCQQMKTKPVIKTLENPGA